MTRTVLVFASVMAVLDIVGCATRAHLDVNSASTEQLAKLPGLSESDANRIVAQRPYYSKDELLRRQVISETQYAQIRDLLDVGPPGTPDHLKWVPPMTR